jgi:hypothetical protein
MIKVLLYIDQKRRDQFGVMKLHDRLAQEKNLKVKVSGKLDFLLTVVFWKPHIIVCGKVDTYHGDWLRCIDKARVLSLYTEQGFDCEQTIYETFISGHTYIRPPANDKVDCFFLFSQRMKNVLEEWLPHEKLMVTGSPRVLHKKPATVAKPPKRSLTIGIALGADLGDSLALLAHYESYREMGEYSDFINLESYYIYLLLEKLWLDLCVKRLSEKYHLIVRPRFCNQRKFSADNANIVYDWSDNLVFFSENSDVILIGESTVGIETMVTGVPVISIAGILNPGFRFEQVLQRNYVKPLWQPSDYEALLELIKRREKNDLPLSPNVEDYLSIVKANFFGGNDEDLSVKKITDIVLSTEIKGEAEFDLARYKTFFGKSKEWLLLRFLMLTNHAVLYRCLMKYLKHKVKAFNKKNRNHGIFINT